MARISRSKAGQWVHELHSKVCASIATRPEDMRMPDSPDKFEQIGSVGSASESKHPLSAQKSEACRIANPDADEALPCVQRTRQHSTSD